MSLTLRRKAPAHPRPTLPSVNLLPPEAFARMAARVLRRRFVAGGLALVLLVGAAWGVQHVRVGEARKLVAVEQAETSRLNAETQMLAPVRTFVTGVLAQERTVQAAMEREVYFSEVLDELRSASPVGAQVQSLDVTLADATDPAAGTAGAAGASACPGPDPFQTREVVGCVTLSGTADSRATVGQLVVNLGDSDLFVEPFISTTTTGDAAAVSFSGSVGLSPKVFSKRYAHLDRELGAPSTGTPSTGAPSTTPSTTGGAS